MRRLEYRIKTKKSDMGTSFFIILFVLVLLIQMFIIIDASRLVSLMFSSIFILLLFCLSSVFKKTVSKNAFLIIGYLFFQTFFGVLLSTQTLSISYLTKMLNFFSTVLSLFFVSFYPLNSRIVNWIYKISIIQSLVFVMAYLMGLTGEFGHIKAITFGFLNPNLTGMWLLHIICINSAYLCNCTNKKKWVKFIFASFLNLIQIYFLFLTQNRSSIIGVIILIIGLLLNFFRKKKYFTLNHLLVGAIPLLIVILYYWLTYSGMIKIFEIFSSVGKELTSRITVWNIGLETFMAHPFTGDYNAVLYTLPFSQMHNVYIDLLSSYGVIVAILFYLFLIKVLRIARRKIKTLEQTIAYWGIIAVFIPSGFESALVSGSTGMYLMTCSLFILINCLKENRDE